MKRALFWILVAAAVSCLPLVLRRAWFLWLPGGLATVFLLSVRAQIMAPAWLRVLSNTIVWSLLLYFGSVLLKWGRRTPVQQTPGAARALFIFWIVLLLPWLMIAPLSAMAFDGGYTAEAYAFVWSVWSYPITVGLTAVLRRWSVWAIWLPLLNVAGCFSSGLLHNPH